MDFDAYVMVWVKRAGRGELTHVCEPRRAGGFWCGACNRVIVRSGYRWRCRCGARVVGALPVWMAQQQSSQVHEPDA